MPAKSLVRNLLLDDPARHVLSFSHDMRVAERCIPTRGARTESEYSTAPLKKLVVFAKENQRTLKVSAKCHLRVVPLFAAREPVSPRPNDESVMLS